MPNIKSAKKRVIVNSKKALQNQMVKSNLKTVLKKYNSALEDGNKENIDSAYRLAVKKLDQAGAKGVLHKNTIARKKSQLTLKLKKVGA